MPKSRAGSDLRRQPAPEAVAIDKVGVSGLCYPVVLLDKAHRRQHTVARINMYVDLPQQYRGTYMGRFVEILNRYHREIDLHKIGTILRDIRSALEARSSHLEMTFSYFIEKKAPVTGAVGLMDYNCSVVASLTDRFRLRLGVTVPVATFCPCSKDMVQVSAHSQRAEIMVSVEFTGFLWLEDLIDLIEDCGSSEVYSLLRREDEKHLTSCAFDNPVFVEDVARKVAVRLTNHQLVTGFEVAVKSHESIHNHDVYAYIARWERTAK